MPNKQQQADSEIHEDQLRNFLVNIFDKEISLDIGANAEIDAEDIYEVLVGARADGTSVSTLCNSSENSPAANTILYHLRTKFEPETYPIADDTGDHFVVAERNGEIAGIDRLDHTEGEVILRRFDIQ